MMGVLPGTPDVRICCDDGHVEIITLGVMCTAEQQHWRRKLQLLDGLPAVMVWHVAPTYMQ